MEHEITYKLETPIRYARGGEPTDAVEVVLREPTQEHMEEIGNVRQWVARAIQDAADAGSDAVREAKEAAEDEAAKGVDSDSEDTESDEEDESVDPKMMIALLATSTVPLGKVYQTTRKLLQAQGIAFLDGDTKITPPLWRKFTGGDMEAMIGAYIAAFLLR